MTYFSSIGKGVKTTLKGMRITLRHLWNARISKGEMNIRDKDFFNVPNGHVTLQYPHQEIEVPDNGRYQLDCEIDDCIVCDKCAKICPVDCIEIEAIKSPELIRHTSDGSPVRLHAAKFDIDMAKCCFCGLCTTVCPTECLTMNSEYDYSTVDVTDLNFIFSDLSEEEADEKKALYEQYMEEKAALKAEKAAAVSTSTPANRPIFKPIQKPASEQPRPMFKPSQKPIGETNPKPAFKPSMKPASEGGVKPKPAFKPGMKPTSEGEVKPKPAFKPSMKPKSKEEVKPKPIDKSDMKPKSEEGEKPKAPFKPTMKPKK